MTSLYRFSRHYTGPVRACILDWSGTTADKYCISPVKAVTQVFESHKVPITMEESRVKMGLRKDIYIREILKIPSVTERWNKVYGRDPNQADVDKMFKDFIPIQVEILKNFSELIPGTSKAIDTLKTDLNCKIGSTTGFTRVMVDVLLEAAVKQGYKPHVTVAGDEVNNGSRPKPHMIYRNMDLLNISPIQSVVKVDDTASGICEALEAGCWAIGVAKFSNYMNINSLEEEKNISEEEMINRLAISRDILMKSGAHYVIDSISQLPEIVVDINSRLSRGEKP